jgi:hypothetical protein
VLEGGKQKELITGYYTVDEICIKYEFIIAKTKSPNKKNETSPKV